MKTLILITALAFGVVSTSAFARYSKPQPQPSSGTTVGVIAGNGDGNDNGNGNGNGNGATVCLGAFDCNSISVHGGPL